MIKTIDKKDYFIREVTMNDILKKELLEYCEEYEELKKSILETDKHISNLDLEINSLEFNESYKINVLEKDKFTNKEMRESEQKKR